MSNFWAILTGKKTNNRMRGINDVISSLKAKIIIKEIRNKRFPKFRKK